MSLIQMEPNILNADQKIIIHLRQRQKIRESTYKITCVSAADNHRVLQMVSYNYYNCVLLLYILIYKSLDGSLHHYNEKKWRWTIEK